MTAGTLTDIPEILYLLTHSEGEGEKMPGAIRTKEKCPICLRPFKHINKIGFICPQHKTTPKRFFLDLSYQGKRVRLYSHKSGRILCSYQLAIETLNHVHYEIRNKTFDPASYIKADIKKYYFEVLFNDWLKDKSDLAESGELAWGYVKSLKIYSEKYIKPFFKGRDVRDMRAIDIKNFKKYLPAAKSAKYRKNILNALENFFNTLLQDELIEKKPIFPVIPVNEPCIKWCNRETQDLILNAIPDRHRFIFFFLTRQGLRPGEAVAIRWEDIDLSNGILTVRRTMSDRKILERTKTKKTRPRLLHPDIYDILKSIPRGLPNTYLFINPNSHKPYLTDSLQRLWKKACQNIGIEISLYEATRHSVASMAATSGVDINIIKEVLGHTDIRTTQKYAHIDVLSQGQVFMAQEKTVPRLSPELKTTKIYSIKASS